jgi:uncharacterized protein
MTATSILILCALILLIAIAYSAVGQAGATGYLAVMALVGIAPEVMKPTALVLNLLVAAVATYRLHGTGLIDWRTASPLLVASVPAAFIGGAIQLPDMWFRYLVGTILIVAALIVLSSATLRRIETDRRPARLPMLPALASGLMIGGLAGLTGTGGGIFLSPLLLATAWANARSAPGVTAPFNLLNSGAALAGNVLALRGLPPELPYFVVAAVTGAAIGTQMGIAWLSVSALQRLLAILLFVAGVKFVVG